MYNQLVKLKKSDISIFIEKLNQLIKETSYFPKAALHYYSGVFSITQLHNNFDKYLILLAKKDRVINGILLGTKPEGGVATIIWLLVDNKIQKSGLGKQLFHAALNEYNKIGCHKIKLTVPKKEVISFYEKQGMMLEGFHPNHWWNMDIWSMGIDLNKQK